MSWISSIFHPFRTSSELEQMREKAEADNALHDLLQQQICEFEHLVQTHEQTVASIKKECDGLHHENEDLKKQLFKTQSELVMCGAQLERAHTDLDKLDEIQRLIERFGQERDKYISRINRLKTALSDARESMRRFIPKQPDQEVTTIDFSHKTPPQKIIAETPLTSNEEENDWLMPLPKD